MIPFFMTLVRFVRTLWISLKTPEFRALTFMVVTSVLLGAWFYHVVEGWRWIDSIYFTVITLTTIGYGDFSPKTDAGKLFTIFYIFLGLGLLVGYLNALGENFLKSRFQARMPKDPSVQSQENEEI